MLAKGPLQPQTERRSIGHGERTPIQSVSQDRLWVARVDQIAAFIVEVAVKPVVTVEQDEPRAGLQLRFVEKLAQWQCGTACSAVR